MRLDASERRLDNNGRVSLDQFTDARMLYMARGCVRLESGLYLPHLMVHTPANYMRFVGRIRRERPKTISAYAFEEVHADNQGRVRIPMEKRKYAGIEKDCRILLPGRWIELWEPCMHDAYSKEVTAGGLPVVYGGFYDVDVCEGRRIGIPSAFQGSDCFYIGPNINVYVGEGESRHRLDPVNEEHRFLCMYPPEQFNALAEQARKADVVSLFTGNLRRVDVDSGGRIVVPRELAEYIAMKERVFVVGAYNRIEIWDIEEHLKYRGDHTSVIHLK